MLRLALTVCLAAFPLLGDAPEAVPSRITRVVAYPQHAEITREVTFDAVAGENLVSFGDLVPILNPYTLRATVSPGARVTGTESRTIFLKESLSEEINRLDVRIRELQDAVAVEAKAGERLEEEAAFYRIIKTRLAQDVGREVHESSVTVTNWQEVLRFVGEGLADNDAARTGIELRVRDLENELQALLKERAAFDERQPKEMKAVEVAFVSEAAARHDVRIHYMVPAAKWRPSYDVHLDREHGEVEVIGYGEVMQWTGEAWDDVALSLAMSRPDAELSLPELTPLVVSLDEADLAKIAKDVFFLGSAAQDKADSWTKTRFKRRQERETFRRNLELLSQNSSKNLAHYGLSHQLIEGAMDRLADRFAGVRYEVETRETIPFDSSPHKVVAFSARIPARLKYVATPALGDSVMLQAEIVNTTGQPILEGTVALFVNDSYVGSAKAGGAAQNEGLSFGFGPDDGLVVQRRLVSRTVKGPEKFRQSQLITFTYEIDVQNFNDHAVDVEVDDQMPTSKTADIQVSFLGSSHEPLRDETSGRLQWSLAVGPSVKSTLTYAFSVECPVNRTIHWQ